MVYVSHRIDKFERRYVNGTTYVYSSDYNSTDRASAVKSMFVLSGTDEIHPYFGIIRFFFGIKIRHKDSTKQDLPPHMCLKTWAYVTWMNFKTPEKDPHSGLYMGNKSFYQRNRIISPQHFMNRCILIPSDKGTTYTVAELPH